MKRILFILFILTGFQCYSQINMDSLLNELLHSNQYQKIEPTKRLLEEFQRYESTDGQELYEVYFDSTGKLNEYLGLTVSYFLKDKKGRTIKRVGYNLKGEYYLWDLNPITEYKYLGDSTITDYFDSKSKLEYRNLTIVDSQGRIIEKSEFDNQLQLVIKIATFYNDKENEIIVKRIGRGDVLKPNKNGLSIQVKKTDSADSTFVIEEQFLDSNSELIDADHNDLGRGIELKYSYLKRKIQNGETIENYYNVEGVEVCRVIDGISVLINAR
ncbi:MAG: hypothetical protein H6607_05315 [Flavobacteriales bacterium]|nr:hypothetical protein [Flavobacteriales bacterium]